MLWKKATLMGLAGFAVGVAIGIVLAISGSVQDWKTALPHILMGGLQGAVAMGSSVMYEIEKWSIARATATHFLLVFALYFVISLSMEWFRVDDPVFWIVIACMAAAYFLIWLIQYMAYKREVRKMNEKLKKWKVNGNGSA